MQYLIFGARRHKIIMALTGKRIPIEIALLDKTIPQEIK
jgi:hypothetical protein